MAARAELDSIDLAHKYVYGILIMARYSTLEVARAAGVSKNTLLRWLYAGAIAEPKHQRNGGQDVRIWTEQDLRRVRSYKQANYGKGRGRKKKS